MANLSSHRPADFFDRAELRRIRDASREAEGRTSGEIVPFVVGHCDAYAETAWIASLFGALTAAVMMVVVPMISSLFWFPLPGGPILPVFTGAAIGYWIGAKSIRVKRWLIPRASIDRHVALRAEAAFLEEEVFDTRERTGILLFLALFEHRALVLADEGINAQVDPSEWQEIVDHLVAGIKQGEPAEALAGAIAECGEILASRKVERRPDDTNELSDAVRLRDS